MSSAIVIPTYNRIKSLQRCLAALAWAPQADVRVVVANSGSTDGTKDWLCSAAPWVDVVQGTDEWWWTAATYFGCEYAAETLGCDELALLNDDCIWSRDAFHALRSCLAEHPTDIICSQVVWLDNPRRLLNAGGRVAWSGRIEVTGWGQPVSEHADPCQLVDWCSGMGVIFRTATWRAVGGHDWKAFPQTYADADFPLRAKRLGVRTWVCYASTLANDRSTTGLGVPKVGATWKHLWLSLTSRRSLWNLPDASRFYLRHARWKYPLAMAHVYGLHLATSVKWILFGRKP